MSYFIATSDDAGKYGADPKGYVQPHPQPYDNRIDIIRFDFAEWRRYWGTEELPPGFDILDLGYWYDDRKGSIKYEEPALDWREDRRDDRDFPGGQIPSIEEVILEVVDAYRDRESNGPLIDPLGRFQKAMSTLTKLVDRIRRKAAKELHANPS